MALPMFPLGQVLFPTMALPLHVFEPRYREMTRECLAGDREFGVVLIERGSEVGGGDVRTDVGTVAEIAEARELPDGRWLVAAVGTRRLRVLRWLADDPYPQATVEDWPDDHASPGAVADRLDPVVAKLRRTLGLRSELGEPAAPATIELDDDPVTASYQAAAVAPLGPADRQALLAAPGAVHRLDLLDRLLDEEIGFLQHRLAEG